MNTPTGFNCSWCRKRHNFETYVFAHWRDILVHVCDCDAKHTIICGRIWRRTKQGKKSKKAVAD